MHKFLQRFRRNNKGLAYVWGVAACTLVFFPVIFWIMSVLLDGVAASVLGAYTFLGVTASAWLLVKTLISALPVFTLLIVLLWASVNAKAQSMET